MPYSNLFEFFCDIYMFITLIKGTFTHRLPALHCHVICISIADVNVELESANQIAGGNTNIHTSQSGFD